MCFAFFQIYTWLAERLTEVELLRTQTEFDDSLTLKIYLLQFVNYYASIFYIAFFKGKFIGYPGNYNRLFGFRKEEVCEILFCSTSDCISCTPVKYDTLIMYPITFYCSVAQEDALWNCVFNWLSLWLENRP